AVSLAIVAVIATTTSVPMASSSSSTNSPKISRNAALSMAQLHARATRRRDREQADGEEDRNEAEQRQVLARPRDPQPLAGPEHAEGREHHPDAEFERVLR